jgi:HEAT repeat protein
MRKLSLFVTVCMLLTAFGTPAEAKKKQGKRAAPSAQFDRAAVGDAIHKLKSPNPEEVMSAVMVLAASSSSSAVGPLIDLLRSGPRNDITNGIIQALGSIGAKSSITIIIEYLGHRRPDARIASLYALENFKDEQVTKAMEDALRDSDAQVRATAALSLGKRGSKSSVTILFQAFDRTVYDAAISIGQIGTTADADRMAGYLGKNDVSVLLPGFDEFLRRPDLPKKAKIKILNQLFELAGPDVRRFAIAYKASFPPETDEDENELYKLVCRMVRQIQEE